jgi:hypothetical protein
MGSSFRILMQPMDQLPDRTAKKLTDGVIIGLRHANEEILKMCDSSHDYSIWLESPIRIRHFG